MDYTMKGRLRSSFGDPASVAGSSGGVRLRLRRPLGGHFRLLAAYTDSQLDGPQNIDSDKKPQRKRLGEKTRANR